MEKNRREWSGVEWSTLNSRCGTTQRQRLEPPLPARRQIIDFTNSRGAPGIAQFLIQIPLQNIRFWVWERGGTFGGLRWVVGMYAAATTRSGRTHESPLLMGFGAMTINHVAGPKCIEVHERPLLMGFRAMAMEKKDGPMPDVPCLIGFGD